MNEIETLAADLAERIKRRYPEVETRISLETMEGEDAYVWIAAPRNRIDEIRTAAASMVGKLWEAGYDIVPRMEVLDHQEA